MEKNINNQKLLLWSSIKLINFWKNWFKGKKKEEERENITTDYIEIQKIIRGYKNNYGNEFDKLCLDRYKLPSYPILSQIIKRHITSVESTKTSTSQTDMERRESSKRKGISSQPLTQEICADKNALGKNPEQSSRNCK